jgi:aminoglycoside phosphotransferase
MLERACSKSSGRFVLTHGDLTPRNILVQDDVITGIVDWEYSGFYPEYAEYAFATVLRHSHETWWLPVLTKVQEPCSGDRLKFESLVEKRGF